MTRGLQSRTCAIRIPYTDHHTSVYLASLLIIFFVVNKYYTAANLAPHALASVCLNVITCTYVHTYDAIKILSLSSIIN